MRGAGKRDARPEGAAPASGLVSPTADGEERERTVSRRQVLCAAALAGACAPLLAGCGSSSNSSSGGSAGGSSAGGSSGQGSGSSGGGSGGGGGKSAGGGKSPTIVTTSQVPKGGGVILPQYGVVVTQPKPGEFNGFSSTCTHAGCPLHDVSDGTINCICHGSRFSITNGSVVVGPAMVPLPKVRITVHGKDISLG